MKMDALRIPIETITISEDCEIFRRKKNGSLFLHFNQFSITVMNLINYKLQVVEVVWSVLQGL